jgi:hypothetical protein
LTGDQKPVYSANCTRSSSVPAAKKSILDRDVTLVWGDRRIKTIARRDVNELLDGIIGGGAAVQANRTHAQPHSSSRTVTVTARG